MKGKVTDEGLLIPKRFLEGVDEVEIYRENNATVIVPLDSADPILELGKQPITDNEPADASEDHDRYLTGISTAG